MRVLGFDTSAGHVAASLLIDGHVAAHAHREMARGQSEHLMPLLEQVMREGATAWTDLTRIGVGVGPGNFTGIRISVSAARGLALGLGIPAIGVSCLVAQATGLDNVISCLPAPRNQIYMQILSSDDALPPRLCAMERSAFPDWSHDTAPAIVGPQADGLADLLGAQVIAPKYSLTEAIARQAAIATDTKTRPAPLYLKPADAAPSRDTPPKILS